MFESKIFKLCTGKENRLTKINKLISLKTHKVQTNDHCWQSSTTTNYVSSRSMPAKKGTTASTVESGTRVTTRASNANKHPGTEAKKALQVRDRRDPEVIQADKEKKRAAKEAKEEAQQAEAAQRKIAQQNLEVCRARQAASLENEDETPSHEQAKSKSTSLSILSFNDLIGDQKDTPSIDDSATTVANKPASVRAVASKQPPKPRPITSTARPATPVASGIRGQKRKPESDIQVSTSPDDELVAGKKKVKKTPSANPPQRPAPRPTSRALKTQPAASGQKPPTSTAIEPAEEAPTRNLKRPVEGEMVDESALPVGPPSKKVKSGTAKASKSQALRRAGSSFHI
jgi:hypothetical protein